MKLLTHSLIALFIASLTLSACSKNEEEAGAADSAVTTDMAPEAAPAEEAPAAEESASEEPGGWVPPAEGS